MKRTLVALLLVAALAAPAFGQETPLIMQDTIDGSNTPATMLSWMTNGIFYDEWDIIIRSPAELSNYEGYGLYTAYGNYQSWRTTPVGTTANPFTTGAFTPGDFYLGATMPLFGFRAGAIMGFDGALTANYDGGTYSVYEAGETDTEHDALTGLLNQYAWDWSSSYTDYTQNNAIRMGAGIDLGFMGVSLYSNIDGSTRKMGGLYSYTNTASTTAADPLYVRANDIVSSYTVAIGGNADGKAQSFGTDGSWETGVTAEYPLFDWLPITATLSFGGEGNLATAPAPATLPVTETKIIANLTGATTSTATYTTTHAAGTWDSYEFLLPANEQTDSFNGFTALTKAADLESYKNSTFQFGGSVAAEPSFDLNDTIGINGIVGIGYALSSLGRNDAYTFSESFTGVAGATTGLNRVTASHSYTESADRTAATNLIGMNLGGVVEMKAADERLVFGLGLVANPSFSGTSTTYTNAETRETWSLTDPANTILDQGAVTTVAGAAALMSNAAAIASQGTKTETTTTVYGDKDSVSTTAITFVIPVSAQLKLADKWTLFAGYDIQYSVSSTETVTATRTTTTTYAVTNAAGTSVYAPTDAVAPTVTPGTRSVTVSDTAPAGRMGFMLRWLPTDAITVDLLGSSVMNALNFDLLGGNGFNPRSFINALSMSVSFRL